MNSLVATSLVLLLSIGLGCSQNINADLDFFNYTDPDPDRCIKIQMQLEVNITYEQNGGGKNWTVIPGNEFSTEPPLLVCNAEESTASIAITWMEDFDITLNFEATENKKQWSMSSMEFQYMNGGDHFYEPEYDGDTMNGTTNGIQNIKWNTSYFCGLNRSFQLNSEGTEGGMAEVMIPYIRVQVFALPESGNFTEGQQCNSSQGGGSNDDDDDKIVPIAVGCALAGLVVIVLIAYLIGRFRNRKTDTYQVLS